MEINIDDRSEFANRICKLLYNKHNGNVDEAIKEGKLIFDDLHEYVRNIYELIGNEIPFEIPLMYYNDLLTHGKENYDMSDEEYNKAIIDTKKACELQYT